PRRGRARRPPSPRPGGRRPTPGPRSPQPAVHHRPRPRGRRCPPRAERVRLRDLAAAVDAVRSGTAGPDRDPDLTAVVHTTGDVRPGALFCCVRGSRVDGHDLAPDALAAGAAALVVDHPLALDAPQLVVADVRAALG